MLRPPSSRRVGARFRLLVGAALAVLAFVVAAVPAVAHTSLVGMTPGNGATVTTAPVQVVLMFDEAVEQLGDGVVVTAPSGANVGSGAPVVDGALVTQQLVALTEPGRYTVAYRVVSDDGHPVTGSLGFTLAATGVSTTGGPSTAASSPAPQPQASASLAADRDADASPIGPMIVGALILLALAAGASLVVWRRNRR